MASGERWFKDTSSSVASVDYLKRFQCVRAISSSGVIVLHSWRRAL